MTMGLAPVSASRRRACSRCASDCISSSFVGAAGLGPALGAGIGGLVEGFVELAAEIEDQRRIGQRGQQRQRKAGAGQQGFHQGHVETSEGLAGGDSARMCRD